MVFKYKKSKTLTNFIFLSFLLIAIVCNNHNVFASEFRKKIEIKDYLLRPKVEKIIFEDNIYTLEKEGKFYFSIYDFINIIEFNIDYDDSVKIGKGWFLREDWKIYLDIEKRQVTSKDIKYAIEEEDYFIQDDIVFIAQSEIEKWFDLTLDIDTAQQFIDIQSPYPLPYIARYNRQN